MSHITQIPFHRQTLVAIEHDGRPYVVMRPIVENMGLDWKSQHAKLTDRFGRRVQRITTRDTLNRQQEMICLPLFVLPSFLFSITASKVKRELRELVIAYQDECTEVLFKHFFGKLTGEHHALIEALFKNHPQWQDTADKYRAGLRTGQIAALQGRHPSNVRRMRRRIEAASIDLRAAARLH